MTQQVLDGETHRINVDIGVDTIVRLLGTFCLFVLMLNVPDNNLQSFRYDVLPSWVKTVK